MKQMMVYKRCFIIWEKKGDKLLYTLEMFCAYHPRFFFFITLYCCFLFSKDSIKYLFLNCFLEDKIKSANSSHFYWNGYKFSVVFQIDIAYPLLRTSFGIVSILENHIMGAVLAKPDKMPSMEWMFPKYKFNRQASL